MMIKNKLLAKGIALTVIILFIGSSVIVPNIKVLTDVENTFSAGAMEVFDGTPNTPSQPSGNTSGYHCVEYNYSTSATDPGGLNVSYGWDWDGDLSVDEWTDWYESNETCTIAHNWSDPDNYNISVKAKNTLGDESDWSDPLNVTMQNHPPYEPSNPIPFNGDTNAKLCTMLNWTGGDPDSCDTVTYDVYFGVTNPPSIKVHNQTATNYTPDPPLVEEEEYFWRIVAWDNHGAKTVGPIWSFQTGINHPPDKPKITGPKEVIKDVVYAYNFSAEDPDGQNVYLYIDWGDGTNTSWIGPYPGGQIINLNHSWGTKGVVTIRCQAKDHPNNATSQWSTLRVTVPKTKQSTPVMFYQFLQKLIQQFPLLQWLLGWFIW